MIHTRPHVRSVIRPLLPMMVVSLILVLSTQGLTIPGLAQVMPFWEVMLLYYWSIYRPEAVPEWFVMVIGWVQDALYGTFFGVTALSNLVLRMVVVSQRRLLVKEPFLVVWFGFACLAGAMALFKWLLVSAVMGKVMRYELPAIQYVLAVASYPWVHLLCNKIYWLLRDVRSHAQ